MGRDYFFQTKQPMNEEHEDYSSGSSNGQDENSKPFAPARRLLGKLRLRPSHDSKASSVDNNSSKPSPPSPSNLSILQDLNQAASTADAGPLNESANLQILEDLNQATTTDAEPLTESANLQILEDLQRTTVPTAARGATGNDTGAISRNSKEEEWRRRNIQAAAEGGILDAIVDTTSDNVLNGCGIGEEESVEGFRQQSRKKGTKDETILQDLACAEEEWIHEHGIKI
jgi:hypothetical protein